MARSGFFFAFAGAPWFFTTKGTKGGRKGAKSGWKERSVRSAIAAAAALSARAVLRVPPCLLRVALCSSPADDWALSRRAWEGSGPRAGPKISLCLFKVLKRWLYAGWNCAYGPVEPCLPRGPEAKGVCISRVPTGPNESYKKFIVNC